jgi:hypothetical protein
MPSITSYDLGSTARISGEMRDFGGYPLDPDVVLFSVKAPSAPTGVTYEYRLHEQLVRDSMGNYHVDLPCAEPGMWYYRWETPGTGQGAKEGQFYVKESVVGTAVMQLPPVQPTPSPAVTPYYIDAIDDFGVDPNGVNPIDDALQAMYSEAAGKPIFFGPGNFRMGRTGKYTTDSTAVFTPGVKIQGAGMGITTFISDIPTGGPALGVDTSITRRVQLDGWFKDFSITPSASDYDNSDAFEMRRGFMYTMERLHIHGFKRDGIRYKSTEGDGDACNTLAHKMLRIEQNRRWGIHLEMDPGFNEVGLIGLEHVFFQYNGLLPPIYNPNTLYAAGTIVTYSATNVYLMSGNILVGGEIRFYRASQLAQAIVPTNTNFWQEIIPGGSMKWKGQMLKLVSTAFVLSQCCGLYIPGGAGLANTVKGEVVTFENGSGRDIAVEGCQSFKIEQLHLYHNVSGPAYPVAVDFDAATAKYGSLPSAVTDIEIQRAYIRFTAESTNVTAFRNNGGVGALPREKIRVRDSMWNNWHPEVGQVRFAGNWVWDIRPGQCEFGCIDLNTAYFRAGPGGNVFPIQRNAAGGEWEMACLDGTVYANGLSYNVGTAGLAGLTTHFMYVADIGNVYTLEPSTVVPVKDPQTGMWVKTGDSTRALVGMFRTDINGKMLPNRPMLTRSWWSPMSVSDRLLAAATYTIPTSGAFAEISNTMRLEALLWAGETFDVTVEGSASTDAANGGVITGIGFDGGNPVASCRGRYPTASTAGIYIPVNCRAIGNGLAMGYHYATPMALCDSAANAYWVGSGVNQSLSIAGTIGLRGLV